VRPNDRLSLIVVCTLASVLLAMVVVLLFGLFTPKVDNDKIFAIIGPAFEMIVGVFVGFLGAKFSEAKSSVERDNQNDT